MTQIIISSILYLFITPPIEYIRFNRSRKFYWPSNPRKFTANQSEHLSGRFKTFALRKSSLV